MRIARPLLDRIVAHAVRDAPNECCGLVARRDGGATAVHELENVQASPFRFDVDGMTVFTLLEEMEEGGDDLGAIYHSHTRSEPYPSQTDVNFAAGWPGVEWIIVGVAGGRATDVRSYLIDGAEITEVPLEVE